MKAAGFSPEPLKRKRIPTEALDGDRCSGRMANPLIINLKNHPLGV